MKDKAIKDKEVNNLPAAVVFVVFAVVLLIAFLAYRSNDIGQLPSLVGNLGGGPLFGDVIPSIAGLMIASLILQSWLGVGKQLYRLFGDEMREETSVFLMMAIYGALGAAAYSLLWFVAGVVGGYWAPVAIVFMLFGSAMQVLPGKTIANPSDRYAEWWKGRLISEWGFVALGFIPVILALIGSIAPPTAKDTLLYHLAVPKGFVATHSNAFIDGNIASYLSLGTEMHSVWAMLLGNTVSPQAGEAAAGVTTFLFFPLLLIATYGWVRELHVSRKWAMIATLLVATVPSAYHVASSGYIDIALALFVTLAIYALTRWWREPTTGWVILMAVFLGAALTIKLTSIFVIAAFALIVLLRARGAESAGKIVVSGFAALLLAGAIASPWYIRTWAATGSPVFPFYMSIWPGKAAGWDVERSNLFQAMNSQYGGIDTNKLNYLTAPARVSIMAQPEQPEYYDGVLGVAFLIGLPLLVWAMWKFETPIEIKIAAGVTAIIYLFWLFSSEQLRYLLPIIPALAVGIAASVETIGKRLSSLKTVAQYAFIAAAICGLLTTAAWFCRTAPLRVALGGETRDQYLTRNLDYYPFYETINKDTAADARVWLINMRRDTYNIDRPVLSDYLFEDWTLRRLIWESRSLPELKAKAAAMNVQYVLTRYDFLFDYDRSTLVDDKKPRAENEAKLKLAKEFILDPANTIRADNKFSLIKVF